jgi:hypothetical protein
VVTDVSKDGSAFVFKDHESVMTVDDEVTGFLRNVRNHPPTDTESHLRKAVIRDAECFLGGSNRVLNIAACLKSDSAVLKM